MYFEYNESTIIYIYIYIYIFFVSVVLEICYKILSTIFRTLNTEFYD